MAKTTVTPLQLAEKYLIKIGLDKRAVKRALLPSLFDENLICKSMENHNLVPKNKNTDPFTQTHIHINKFFWGELYTKTQIKQYHTTGNDQKSKQKLEIFEANIAALLQRRNKKLSPLVVPAQPSTTYSLTSSSLLTASTYKKFFDQSGAQVHIGIEDDNTFLDFRLGILLKDYLILLKYAKKDSILAIAIPAEFCSKYTITEVSRGTSRINRKLTAPAAKQRKAYATEDGDYIADSNDSSAAPEFTPLSPVPAPKGTSRGSSTKPKYRGKPSRGKGAISKAKNLCEWDSTHTTFLSNTTGKAYMEPHHLIPISEQELYDNDIDITPNLICLCPNCHKRIHLGRKPDVEKMLTKFYADRNVDLSKCGIDIDLNTLLAYYDVY